LLLLLLLLGALHDRALTQSVSAAPTRSRPLRRYAQYNYTPEINQISRLFGKASSVEALHENARNASLKEEAKRKADEKLQRQCTFQPRLATAKKGKKKKTGGGTFFNRPEKMMARVAREEEARHARLEAAREEHEADELDECTFQPTMHRSRPKQAEVRLCALPRVPPTNVCARFAITKREEKKTNRFFLRRALCSLRSFAAALASHLPRTYVRLVRPAASAPACASRCIAGPCGRAWSRTVS
jgi:hypothetical protein